eukprot:TRINITY_DN6504_c0_g4_i1.p1 TRINITY_DN6504_c0_g4~~TRINITY_DN6504_c0_g4_i1.p1  ORF type:complete len:158 (-),score=28.99 TRINITY_DN6504_c0_g4_i1:107-580(-)
MAGQSEKKLAKKAESFSQYYLFAIIGVNVLYLIFKVFLNWASMGFWNICGLFLYTFVSYFTYGGIQSSLEVGADYEMYLDLFLVNLFSQFLVSFTDWGWLVYLAVPGYVLYRIGGMICNYVFTPTASEMAENDPAARKKAEKMARQEGKQKFKVMKH